MGGDSDCVRYDVVTPTRILCSNAKRQPTGYRDALTPQQITAYQQMSVAMAAQQQAQQAQQPAYIPQPMQAPNYPTMATPQVSPIEPPGGNQVRCISTGIYTNCRAY